MLALQVFPPAFGLKSPSPFSLKAIALMQMSGLDYKIEPGDPRKTPKKKLPVLIDGEKHIPDSTHILVHLKKAHGFDPDIGLNAEQLAIAEAFRRMMEEHLYWILVYSRWIENGDIVREAFFSMVPALMRKFVFSMVAKQVKSALYGQGMGRHTAAEVYAFGAADLQAIANYFGDKQYFFGETPTSIDATLYGSLSNIIDPQLDTPLKQAALSHDNLVAFKQRFAERFEMKDA
ncbi:MAG: glutathione S-transferase family protein [Hyphomicrobiales bacterium]|nr:glutathione S-transferase family protein [Hyphomicrobiales bacterium]